MSSPRMLSRSFAFGRRCAGLAFTLLALAAAADAARALDFDPTGRLNALRRGVARATDSAVKSLDVAQIYNRPGPDVIDDGTGAGGPGPDAGALSTRIDRLERDLRHKTGEIEELQHKVQALEEQLRLAHEGAAAGARPPANGPMNGSSPSPMVIPAPTSTPPAGGARRGDAFDPSSAPAAPGAPKPLGTTAPSAPLDRPRAEAPREPGQPLDISRALTGNGSGSASSAPAELATASIAPAGPKDEYSDALVALRSGQYETAEKSLSAFLARNPKSRLASAATYNLGESFFLRGRHREAAEKYLEISTKYAQSAQAPEALLRLGQSLYALGAKEQACASFSEIGVKYPAASTRVKDAAQREIKKGQC